MKQTGKFHITGFPFLLLSTRKTVRDELTMGAELSLLHITDNQYDPHAIAVVWNDLHIGWVDKNYKNKLKLWLALAFGTNIKATVIELSSMRTQHAIMYANYQYEE